MAFPEQFDTLRLKAEKLNPRHLEILRRMDSDPEVMSTLGGIRSPDNTLEFLRKNLDHWAKYKYGLWIFREKVTGKALGRAGLRNVRVDDRDEIELAYALFPEYWGMGFATEIALALTDLARPQIAELVSFTLTTNIASRRVMEKAGFQFEKELMHSSLPHVLYRHCLHS